MRIFILVTAFLGTISTSFAQCAMCTAASEQSEGISKGINGGIGYLAIIVYGVIALIGYMVYRNYKKTGDDAFQDDTKA